MARYGYRSSSSRSYRSSGSSRGGYTNGRTGASFSSARAHQHVGQSFGGYTKSYSPSSGHYSMRPSGRGR